MSYTVCGWSVCVWSGRGVCVLTYIPEYDTILSGRDLDASLYVVMTHTHRLMMGLP